MSLLNAPFLEAFFSSASERLFIADSFGKIAKCSAGFAHALGYEPDELTGRALKDICVGASYDPGQRDVQQLQYQCRDGKTLLASVTGSEIKDGDQIIGHFGRLVEARSDEPFLNRFADGSLRLTANLYQTIFEQSPISFAIYDLSGAGVLANDAWGRLWSTTRCRVKDFNIRTSKEMDAIGIRPLIEKAYSGEPAHVRPVQVQWPPGRDRRLYWMGGYIFPIKDAADKVQGIAFLTEDVTKQVTNETRLEEVAAENKRLYNEATAAVSARDEFLSIASHELKTPLTALHMAVQVLKANYGKQESVELLKTCERQARRLSTLIHELLDLTSIRAGRLELKRENFDLSKFSRDVIDRIKNTALIDAEVMFSGQDEAIGFWDLSRIEQVITNLLSNAFKYGRGKPITVTVSKRDAWAIMSVSDRGIGIPLEEQEKIFKGFERSSLSRNIGGLGLGLYIVRKIVDAHAGSITLESAPNKGATFTVRLPCRLHR